MPTDIHPSAIIHPDAVIGENIKVGPYAIIDAHVRIGNDCKIGPQVYLTGHTTIGNENVFHSGAVIGDNPQDISYKDCLLYTSPSPRDS